MFGLSTHALNVFKTRLEILENNNFLELNPDKWVVLLKFLMQVIPNNRNIKDRFLLNIFFLDLIVSYRGWRHSRGLPVRGQRT